MPANTQSKTLFDVLLKDATTCHLGDYTLVNFGGNEGAIFINNQEFISGRKWASQHYSTNNPQHDLQLYLGHLKCYVSHRGSGIRAKGSSAHLLRLAKTMPALGLDRDDWNFPKMIMDELKRETSE